VRVLVSRLRKAFAAAGFRGVIQTRPPGYVLVSQLVDVDVHLFEALTSRGRAQLAAGEAGQAVTTLREALAFGIGTRWLSAAIRGWPVRRRVCWRNEWRR
jgi:DNA-binding SARP family transcriptional activator